MKGLYYCVMQPVSVNNLLGDPLAGCWPLVQDTMNGTAMLRAVLLRLRIFHSESISASLGDQIIGEAQKLPINYYQYCINEVLYETRYAQRSFDPMYETAVLNNWAREMLSKHDQDTVLDIIGALKHNRMHRKR